MMRIKLFHSILAGIWMPALLSAQLARAASLNFQLLTWNDANATTELPSAVGRKPSATMPTAATGCYSRPTMHCSRRATIPPVR